MDHLFNKILITSIAGVLLTSCTIYTEKRSEVLSQSVYATSDSIEKGRIELAYKYAQEAKKMAYPPKKALDVNYLITEDVKKVDIVTSSTKPTKVSSHTKAVKTNVITSSYSDDKKETVLRLVIPDFLKNAKLLVENSEEWNELMKIKEYKNKIEEDNERLLELKKDVEEELHRQQKYNNKMVIDLNNLQKEVLAKNLLILRLYLVIGALVAVMGGGVYLKMKGIL